MAVQRVLVFRWYSLSSEGLFVDSRGIFERFILRGRFILKRGVGKLITKKLCIYKKSGWNAYKWRKSAVCRFFDV